MTTLAGLHIPDKGTWIGADMRASSSIMIGPIQKWTRWGDWALGCAGDLRTLDLIQSEVSTLLDSVARPSDVIPRLERMMIKNNYTSATDGPFGPPGWGQCFMLASPHGLWDIDMQLSLYAVPPGIVWGSGSGRDFVLGAGLVSASNLDTDPTNRIRMCLEAAIHYDPQSGHGIWTDHLAPSRTKGRKNQSNLPLGRSFAVAR